MFGSKWFDHADDEYLPEASDRETRQALRMGMDAIEDYANSQDVVDIEAGEEFLRWASTSVAFDLGVI
jgi:hypothetical protein